MLHPKILDAEKAALLVVDIQEAFRFPINDFTEIASRVSIIVRGFQSLELPIFITEQYPKGLGKTAEEILLCLSSEFEILEKSTFSACGAKNLVETLKKSGATQIILCGLETHICINQTAHNLLNEGFEVHLLTDCVNSRFSNDKETALKKMILNGVSPTTVEMALFELLKNSKHDKFKEIQELVK